LPKILVVDDEPMNIEVVKAMLLSKERNIDLALDGKSALNLIEERLEAVYAH
jgi:CheY-like chemotaxis protein